MPNRGYLTLANAISLSMVVPVFLLWSQGSQREKTGYPKIDTGLAKGDGKMISEIIGNAFQKEDPTLLVFPW